MTGLNSGYSCTASSSTNTITISNFVDTAGTAGTSYTFKVSSIKNPGTYSATGTITAQLTTSTGGVIDTGTTTIKALTYTSSTIESFAVTPGSFLAGATSVAYTFTVRPRSRVNLGAYLILKLPTDVGVVSSNTIEISCGSVLSGFSYTKIYCKVSKDQTQVTIMQGFTNANSAGDPPTLIFSIPALMNPRSTQTTAPFNITIFDANDLALYYYNVTTTPTVTMTGATSPKYIKYSRLSQMNGALTSYTWTI